MRLLAALIFVTQFVGPASAQLNIADSVADETVVSAENAFDELVGMVGVWRPADNPQSPLRIHFYLTAGETVLVESWQVRGQPHSLTLYHRDGEGLLATHYCPEGNQPRLELVSRGSDELRFILRDITDLEPLSESYQHDLWFDFSDPEHPVRGESYASRDGVGAQERLRLVSASNH